VAEDVPTRARLFEYDAQNSATLSPLGQPIGATLGYLAHALYPRRGSNQPL
jgi:hypothetical protein